MTAALALLSAAAFGAADFLGGLGSRRASALGAAVVSQLAGLVVLAFALPLLPGAPSVVDLGWGAAGGVAGGVGLVLLYRGLATGRMSVVAPVTALSAAALPLAVGIAGGERPTIGAAAGIAFALAAVVLVSREAGGADPSGAPRRARHLGVEPAIAIALLAGLAFGAFFVGLAQTGEAAGAWPLLGARAASLPLLLALGTFGRRSLSMSASALPVVLAAGVLDMIANLLYLSAARSGLLSLVAVLSSLYPVGTVVLARLVLGERIRRVQGAGLAVGLTAAALIAVA